MCACDVVHTDDGSSSAVQNLDFQPEVVVSCRRSIGPRIASIVFWETQRDHDEDNDDDVHIEDDAASTERVRNRLHNWRNMCNCGAHGQENTAHIYAGDKSKTTVNYCQSNIMYVCIYLARERSELSIADMSTFFSLVVQSSPYPTQLNACPHTHVRICNCPLRWQRVAVAELLARFAVVLSCTCPSCVCVMSVCLLESENIWQCRVVFFASGCGDARPLVC